MSDDRNDAPRGVIPAFPTNTFAARLFLCRIHAGRGPGRPISVRQAAERCGYSHEAWLRWERGETPRDILTVAERVADALNIDYMWLLHGQEPSRGLRSLPAA